jgi:hypothetical protein
MGPDDSRWGCHPKFHSLVQRDQLRFPLEEEPYECGLKGTVSQAWDSLVFLDRGPMKLHGDFLFSESFFLTMAPFAPSLGAPALFRDADE